MQLVSKSLQVCATDPFPPATAHLAWQITPHLERILSHPRGEIQTISPHRHSLTFNRQSTCAGALRRNWPNNASRKKRKTSAEPKCVSPNRSAVRQAHHQCKSHAPHEGAQKHGGSFGRLRRFSQKTPVLPRRRSPPCSDLRQHLGWFAGGSSRKRRNSRALEGRKIAQGAALDDVHSPLLLDAATYSAGSPTARSQTAPCDTAADAGNRLPARRSTGR